MCTFSAELFFSVLSELSGARVGLGEVDACVELDGVDIWLSTYFFQPQCMNQITLIWILSLIGLARIPRVWQWLD